MTRILICFSVLFSMSVQASDLRMDWAYHDDADGIDDRVTELVPGTRETFLANGKTVIPDDESVLLYVITANQFAGDTDEQVYIRWWNGKEEYWIAATWEKNIQPGRPGPVGTFHAEPMTGHIQLDLWRLEVPADVTLPGENFYVIQLKGVAGDQSREHYLLRKALDKGVKNGLGQAWTAESNYFQHDWSVTIE